MWQQTNSRLAKHSQIFIPYKSTCMGNKTMFCRWSCELETSSCDEQWTLTHLLVNTWTWTHVVWWLREIESMFSWWSCELEPMSWRLSCNLEPMSWRWSRELERMSCDDLVNSTPCPRDDDMILNPCPGKDYLKSNPCPSDYHKNNCRMISSTTIANIITMMATTKQ